ncbi:TetR/AcrR family transcriptional regulator [Gryllotalpicola kribbensis]|jgi:AcrR family transcriptional regulator|uniref:TetR/AcrR family transcriptional regulator n=1 Tax=Gryllotalpicola kribbensis TaxID=993084 RepID=UPI0031E12506
MDARSRRSRTALVDAVYRLAVEKGIDNLTVTDVAAEAGVSRDTFYRHSGDPVALLCGALQDELADSVSSYLSMPLVGDNDDSVFLPPAAAVMEHMRNHTAIYRQAPGSKSGARLTAIIEAAARRVIETHLDNHPEIVPEQLQPMTEITRQMSLAYASSGATAAFFAWINGDDLGDVRHYAQVVLLSGPEWWLGLPTPVAKPRSREAG